MSRFLPRQPAPSLTFTRLNGSQWTLADAAPESFTLLVIYRGFHCGICKGQLEGLASNLDDFAQLGTDVVAVSADPKERAEKSADGWQIDGLTLGYGMELKAAESWGLFISASRRETETKLFFEPALFLIRPDTEIVFAQIQNMPFARPSTDTLLDMIAKIRDNSIPARGEVSPLSV